ncbi:hypothetical protein ACQKQC_05525 [Vibrio fortis]|uniref:hypothetical protein n=1 Tax=Vibrio fortis TaxID=212667 RepID=UPI0040697204
MINSNDLTHGSFMLAAELNISHCGKPLTGETVQSLIQKHIFGKSDADIKAESKGQQRSITKMALDTNTGVSTKANTLRALANAIESNSKIENYNFLVELGNLIDTIYKDYESAIFNPIIKKLYGCVNSAVFGCSSMDQLTIRVSHCKDSGEMSVEFSSPSELNFTIGATLSGVARTDALVEGKPVNEKSLSESSVIEMSEQIVEIVENLNISKLVRLPVDMASNNVKQILGSIPTQRETV